MLLQSSLELVTWLLPLYKIQNVLMFTTLHWVLLSMLFVPILTLLGMVWILRGIRSLQRSVHPIRKAPTTSGRKPAERAAEKLDQQVNDIFIWTFFQALITAIIVSERWCKAHSGSAVAVIIIITAVSTAFVFLVWRLINLIDRRRDYRLALPGSERWLRS